MKHWTLALRLISRALSQCHERLFLVTPLILNNRHIRVVFLLLILGWSVFHLWKRSDMYYILYVTITSLLANLAMGKFVDSVVCRSKVDTSYFATARVTMSPWLIRLRSGCKATPASVEG